MLRFSFTLAALLFSLALIDSGYAGDAGHTCGTGGGWCREGGGECSSGGHGNCGKRKGDLYGARRAVNSTEDARSRFNEYFAGKNVTISDIAEKPWRFEVDVKNQNGDVVDRVIIDKRSGRVRSIY